MTDAPRAAGVMIVAGNRALFLLRNSNAEDAPGVWCWPGGGIEPGETPKRAARREVFEETGIELHGFGKAIDQRNGFRTYRAAVGGEWPVQLNREHDKFVWAPLNDPPRPLHPGVEATLRKLARRERPRYQFAGVRFTADGRRLIAADAKPTLPAIRAAAGHRVKYEAKLHDEIDELARSLLYWLRAAYRADTPATVELAADASASSVLQAAFDKLRARWLRRFDELAPKMADWFVAGSKARVDGTMQAELRRAGFTVKFKMTKAMRDAYNAVVNENVGLIRSIAEQHLGQVETLLNQSVSNGRDLAFMTRELEKRTGVTKRRAAFIARDQNNKATAVMVRTRALQLGITKAKWLHSSGGKTPRPEHKAFSGKTFDLAKGHDFHNGEGTVWPGTAINCRCVAVPVVPGFD